MTAGVYELTRADAWLAAALATPTLDALLGAGRRHGHLAPAVLADGPDDIGDRHVVWTLATTPDDIRTATRGDGRIITSAVYAVKAVGTVDAPLDLEPIADAVDAALEGRRALTAGLAGVCARVAPLLYPEVTGPGAPLIWHVGSTWLLELTTP